MKEDFASMIRLVIVVHIRLLKLGMNCFATTKDYLPQGKAPPGDSFAGVRRDPTFSALTLALRREIDFRSFGRGWQSNGKCWSCGKR